MACDQKSNKDVEVIEEYYQVGSQNNNKQLWVVSKHFKNISLDSISKILSIHLEGNPTRVLGNYNTSGPGVTFEPLIPFTRGKKYEARAWGKLISLTEIEAIENSPMAALGIYPSTDTVPENLLKIYLEFSYPMQDGNALEHIALLKNGKDTMKDVFLDLQPELWNKEGTVLTLWLDPGRIKQDLQPNMKMGNPLKKGDRYSLIVKHGWQDINGLSTRVTYDKQFVVGPHDNRIPDYQSWTITSPKHGTSDSLKISLHEHLDYQLLKNAIRIIDKNGRVVDGTIQTKERETVFVFMPTHKWQMGDYVLEIESRLEDLAGNNLNRPFERDITNGDTVKAKQVYTRSFRIQ